MGLKINSPGSTNSLNFSFAGINLNFSIHPHPHNLLPSTVDQDPHPMEVVYDARMDISTLSFSDEPRL